MSDNIKGLNQIYNPETGKTSVTWSYKDDSDLDYFVLEYYDEVKRKWVPYDGHMGIIRKEDSASRISTIPEGGMGGGGSGAPGSSGKDGKSLEFEWQGSSLGVRKEGDSSYQFVDLEGQSGDLSELTKKSIEEALGYTINVNIRLSEDKELEYFNGEKWKKVEAGMSLGSLDGGKPSSEYGGSEIIRGGGVEDGN